MSISRVDVGRRRHQAGKGPLWGDWMYVQPQAFGPGPGFAPRTGLYGGAPALGQPPTPAVGLDRATVEAWVDAINVIMKAYNAKRDIPCLTLLMKEGPQNVANLRGRMNAWLQKAADDARWPSTAEGAEVAAEMIECAVTLRQIIPGIPNAVTYTGGAAASAGLLALVLL